MKKENATSTTIAITNATKMYTAQKFI